MLHCERGVCIGGLALTLAKCCAICVFFSSCVQVMAEPGKRRKMVGRRASASQTRTEYNAELFRSLGCERFHDSIDPKGKFIREKVLRLAPGEFEEIRENIANRGWERLVAYPKRASKALAFEFFSNVYPKPAVDGELRFRSGVSFVRGREVRFDAASINALFGIGEHEILDCMFRTKSTRRTVKED